jgi:hypothetical protein
VKWTVLLLEKLGAMASSNYVICDDSDTSAQSSNMNHAHVMWMACIRQGMGGVHV